MIELNRKQFSAAIHFAACAVESRSTIPAMSMLKATANGSFTLEGSDFDNHTRVEIPYSGDEGEFLLPEPRRVRTALNSAGGDVVRLGPQASIEKRLPRLSVASGQLDSDLVTLEADGHPGTDRIHYEEFAVDLGAAELAQIARILPAVSTEETRYYLNGVCVKKVGDWLYQFCATDGHRLMIVDVPLPNAAGAIPDCAIIPRRWLNIVMSQFAKSKDGSRLSYGKTMVRNSGEGGQLPVEAPGGPRITLAMARDGVRYSLTGKLIDGTYPDYTRVIPPEATVVMRVKRADLAHAINSLTPLSTEKTRAVKMSLGKAGILAVSLNSPSIGNSSFEVPCEHNAPADFEIGMNGGYLLDMIGALRGDEIEFGMTNPAAPVLINDPADTAFRGVQMPMRV